MLSRTTLSALLLTSAAGALAQPTLTEANNAPMAGELYTGISKSTADSILTSPGANETYGCWMLLQAAVRDQHYDDPAVTPTSATIPAATMLGTDGGSDTLFWSSDANGLYLEGERTGIGTFAYSDAVKELAYPLTFGTNWTDAGSATFTTFGLNVVRTVSLVGSGSGYGTLELPALAIDNVLRVSVAKTTFDQGGIANIERRSHITYFFVDTLHIPVLKLQSDSVSISGGAWSVTYINEWLYGQGEVGMADLDPADVHFTCYPNPATEVLNLPLTVNGTGTCEVLDAAGRVVMGRTLAANGPHSLPVSTLPSGAYTLRLVDDEGLHTTRFQVVR